MGNNKIDEMTKSFIDFLKETDEYKRYKKDLKETEFIGFDIKNQMFFLGLKSSKKVFKSCIYMYEFEGKNYEEFANNDFPMSRYGKEVDRSQ